MKLFVYGTLNNIKFLESLLGKKVRTSKDELIDFCQETIFIDNEPYPNIYKCLDGVVFGNLIYGLSDVDLLKLDNYEGNSYRRISVILKSGNNSFVYISD